MERLILKYSLSEIFIFIAMLALAIKEIVTFIEWSKGKLNNVYHKDYQLMQDKQRLKEEFEERNCLYDESFAKIDRTFEHINEQINMLIESDKEDIKSYIVREHHHFVYCQGWIDDYYLECFGRIHRCLGRCRKENQTIF